MAVVEDDVRFLRDGRDLDQLRQPYVELLTVVEVAVLLGHGRPAPLYDVYVTRVLARKQARAEARHAAGGAGSENARAPLRATLAASLTASLTDDRLRRQIVHTVPEIEAAKLAYTGHYYRRERGAGNVRRVVYDLGEALACLHALESQLEPLAREYRGRERARGPGVADVEGSRTGNEQGRSSDV